MEACQHALKDSLCEFIINRSIITQVIQQFVDKLTDTEPYCFVLSIMGVQ